MSDDGDHHSHDSFLFKRDHFQLIFVLTTCLHSFRVPKQLVEGFFNNHSWQSRQKNTRSNHKMCVFKITGNLYSKRCVGVTVSCMHKTKCHWTLKS